MQYNVRNYLQVQKFKMMEQSETSSQKSDPNFKVAPIISNFKLSQLKLKTIGTLFGLPILNHNIKQQQQVDSGQYCECNVANIVLYMILPCIVVIPPLIITDLTLYPIACLIPAVALPIIHLILNFVREQPNRALNHLVLLFYGYLWGTHLFACSQLLKINTAQLQQNAANIALCTIILSVIAITISVSTIAIAPVQQFSITSSNYQYYSLHSTHGMRFITLIPMLTVTAIMFILYLINQSTPLNINTQYLFRAVILYLGLATAIFGLLCIIGWISSFQDTLMFVVNRLGNYLIFNDETFSIIPLALFVFALNVLCVCFIAIFHQGLFELHMVAIAYWTSWGSSMVVISILKIKQMCSQNNLELKQNKNSRRFILCVFLEIIISIGLFLIFYFAIYPQRNSITVSVQNAIIIVGIDIGLYILILIFNQIRSARSIFGCIGCLSLSTNATSIVDLSQRFILRTSSSLSILAIVSVIHFSKVSQSSNIIVTQQSFLSYVLYPTLLYRTFKKCLSNPRGFSTHLPLLIYFILIQVQMITILPLQIVLYFPLMPQNFLGMIFTPFLIPKKLRHSKQKFYKIVYFFSTLFSILLMAGTLGISQFTMIFGLPLFWCVPPKNRRFRAESQLNSPDNSASSPQQALYRKIISEFNPQIFRGKKMGFYLLRISKYLIFVEVSNQCYGLFELTNFVGLQAQEITTCHAKEGETIDRIISQIWDQKQQNKVPCKMSDRIFTAIWPIQEIKPIMISAENQIKFTGIIETQSFYQLFKSTLLKSLIFFYKELLQKYGSKPYEKFESEAQQLVDEIHFMMSKQKCEEIFPYTFAKSVDLDVKYPFTGSNSMGRKKLPPLGQPKKQEAEKKEQVIDDFMDLLNQSSTQNLNVNPKKQQQKNQKKEQKQLKQQKDQVKQNIQNSKISSNNSQNEWNMAVILALYSGILGKISYLNIEKIYNLINRQSQTLSQINFLKKVQLSAAAVGAALKISIGKYLQEQTDVALEDFEYYKKNQFLGTMQSPGFASAVRAGLQDIWTVHYAPIKKLLTVKRIASVETTMHILGMDSHIVKAIWNNLKYELLYATNDDDERYSIQTHQYLMRNLLVEACQEPFGYAGFYSPLMYIF